MAGLFTPHRESSQAVGKIREAATQSARAYPAASSLRRRLCRVSALARASARPAPPAPRSARAPQRPVRPSRDFREHALVLSVPYARSARAVP